jgi:ABC-type lipoprotein export system ATPase subunit
MVTHESHVAAHAQRIIRMRDGLIQSDLPAEEDGALSAHAGADEGLGPPGHAEGRP